MCLRLKGIWTLYEQFGTYPAFFSIQKPFCQKTPAYPSIYIHSTTQTIHLCRMLFNVHRIPAPFLRIGRGVGGRAAVVLWDLGQQVGWIAFVGHQTHRTQLPGRPARYRKNDQKPIYHPFSNFKCETSWNCLWFEGIIDSKHDRGIRIRKNYVSVTPTWGTPPDRTLVPLDRVLPPELHLS